MTKSRPHVLVIPFPAQGHVKPLMLFSKELAKHGFRITFVNSDINHSRIISSANKAHDDQVLGSGSRSGSLIDLVSIPDGLGPDDDRTDLDQFCKAVLESMPAKLEELVETINRSALDGTNDKITCVVSDVNMGWAMKVAAKIGVRGAVFCTCSAAILFHLMNVTDMVRNGTTDSDSAELTAERQTTQLLDGMPAADKAPWNFDDAVAKMMTFDHIFKTSQSSEMADWWLCNTAYNIEAKACSLLPKILPIGPLMANDQSSCNPRNILRSHFWIEDSSCLSWLDQQKPCSVIYVAFGSSTVHDKAQFQELALGLELTRRPFLWVVRPGFISELGKNTTFNPNGIFEENYNNNNYNLGKIVNWAPQQKVLGHPSIACFVSHCGWNSTIEGISNGVPFLCWPYFADQFANKSYICDIWKVGMGFQPNANGMVLREEVKNKVDQLLGDEDIKRRSLELKEMVMKDVAQDGQSSKNFNYFINLLEA